MDSRPPATLTVTSPARIWSAAIMMAFMPEPHILLMVVVGTPTGMPAPSAAWRAGAWPRPAGNTQPMMTSCTSLPLTPAAASAPLMAAVPSCGAVTGASTPWKAPMGVRWAAAMMIDLLILILRLRSSAAAQAQVEHVDESFCDLARTQRGIFAIPVAHPVERTGERERGHLRIAFADRTVGDAGRNERAHATVDAGLELLDAFTHGRPKVLILGTQHAPAEVPDNSRGVTANECEQTLTRGSLGLLAIVERRRDLV